MGKNYLIIGGSTGIAAELVRRLSDQGHTVLTVSRHANGIDTLPGVTHYPYDVTDANASLPALPDTLHGLVYAPGTIRLKPFPRISEAEFLEDFQVNVLGAVRAIQGSLKALRKAKGASVVLFSTVAAGRGMGFHASIAASKGAVEGLARSLASEFAQREIRFNVVAPSLTDTPLAEGLLNTEQKREGGAKRHPLGRIGTATDQANAAYFLLSDESAWMTGQVLGVDGGLSTLG